MSWRRAFMLVLLCLLPTLAAGMDEETLLTPTAMRRPSSATYLAVPSWLADTAQAERAALLAQGMASSKLPATQQLQQLWRGFGLMLKDEQPAPDFLDKAAVLVSTLLRSGELLIGMAYNKLFAAVSEASGGPTISAEERYERALAHDYALFLRQRPWHEFNYAARLLALWRDVPCSGENRWRGWERRYALSTRLAVKAMTAGLHRIGAAIVRKPGTTAVVIDRWLAPLSGVWPDIQRIRSYGDSSELLLLPRQAAVGTRFFAIAHEGADFIEIAGNEMEAPIQLAVRAPVGGQPEQDEVEVMHRQLALGEAGIEHVILRTSVGSLARQLRELQLSGLELEKVFEY